MTNVLPRIETTPLDGWTARDLVDSKQAESVCQAQTDHRNRQLAQLAPTPTLQKIKTEQAALTKRQAELDQREAEQLSLVAEWDRKTSALESAMKRLGQGVSQFEAFFSDGIAGRLEYIDQNAWGTDYGPHSQPQGIMALYANLAGAKLLQEDFPRWRADREAEVAALHADRDAFALKHKIAAPGN